MRTLPGNLYRFGPFQVNGAAGELLKNGTPVKLQDQPFRLLLVLLEHAGEMVSRPELRDRIWPQDTFVNFDSSLRVAVRKLREALGDDAEHPQYVATIPKQGYRFLVADVQTDAITAPVLLIHGRDDTVVEFEQSTAMLDAMKRANKSVEMVTLKKEDHWLSSSDTRLQMLQASVAFLRAHNPPD